MALSYENISMDDMQFYLELAAGSVIVPSLFTLSMSIVQGKLNPVQMVELMIYGPQQGQRVFAPSTDWYLFVVYYFSGIIGFVGGLVAYNLLKMFGLDIVIQDFQRELLAWFTDTTQIIGTAAQDDIEDDDDVDTEETCVIIDGECRYEDEIE